MSGPVLSVSSLLGRGAGTRVRIGLIGCGNISKAYILTAQSFPILEIVAVADVDLARAQQKAREFALPRGCSVSELLADPTIELVVNLTIPKAHAEVALAALNAGKHVYNEKPLALTLEDARQILDTARAKNLRVGCAPGTFLGGGLQTCRHLVDDGLIGRPLAATAFMTTPGHERWHPSPEFYYEPGGGPMFDMGPYYLTALCNLLGPVRSVLGSATILKPERVIGSEPKRGQRIRVQTADHVAGTLEFVGGAVCTMMTSFAIWHTQLPPIGVYGSEGSLGVPDPNSLKGPVAVKLAQDKDWREVPLTHGHADGNKWGIAVADMAHAIRSGRAHRATAENAFHVLEVMQAFFTSSDSGHRVNMESTFLRPAPLPRGLPEDALDM